MTSQAGQPHGTATAAPPTRREVRKVILTAGLGHFVEWFEIGIYGVMSGIIAVNFFPSADPMAGLLSTFAVFAIGFVIRPIGGLFWGPLGDRIGRNRILAIIIMLTSGSTFAIGLIPSYAAIGALAPALLVAVRLVQGFAAGGENSSSITLLFEYAERDRRAYATSWLTTIGFAAFVFGSGLVLAMTLLLGEGAMNDWAWRVPFLIALPLGLIGLYLRVRLQDSPEFRSMEARGELAESPLKETFRSGARGMLVLGALAITKAVAHWTLQTFMFSYLETTMGFTVVQAFLAGTICLTVCALLIPPMAVLSDRIGRKPLLIAGAAGFVVFSYPALWLTSLGDPVLAILGMILLGVWVAAFDSALGAAMAELFPPRTRNGSISIAYNVAVALFGGTAPYIATWLVVATGHDLAPAGYIVAIALVSLVTAVRIRETAGPRAAPAA
ncbi:MHS family proline/betaine transporter-like MFS transporter [Murinocardiopsis flavida]|uniref:MHS family proline/betaine transporter-like MFS transporter n=1 Tax=Murinocardiopsis flavida TaxID=645275 RepID=A0A2P8D6U1_9ACTN|nr:MFS transporter [Murinocardiopsis flavida]PSK92940.1 MHS family proline/betaine transporter-like MFS transporter [Murinocardiopsis flavida]